jgi:hypothetical protein
MRLRPFSLRTWINKIDKCGPRYCVDDQKLPAYSFRMDEGHIVGNPNYHITTLLLTLHINFNLQPLIQPHGAQGSVVGSAHPMQPENTGKPHYYYNYRLSMVRMTSPSKATL